MYKLLLVSDKEEIRTLYRGYSEWENLGFEQPTIAENAQKGIELLSRNRFDAISCLLSVNEGRIAVSELDDLLASKNRVLAGITAQAHGLYLNRVFYE